MAKWSVRISRQVRESASIEVEAGTRLEAKYKACQTADKDNTVDWYRDVWSSDVDSVDEYVDSEEDDW